MFPFWLYYTVQSLFFIPILRFFKNSVYPYFGYKVGFKSTCEKVLFINKDLTEL